MAAASKAISQQIKKNCLKAFKKKYVADRLKEEL